MKRWSNSFVLKLFKSWNLIFEFVFEKVWNEFFIFTKTWKHKIRITGSELHWFEISCWICFKRVYCGNKCVRLSQLFGRKMFRFFETCFMCEVVKEDWKGFLSSWKGRNVHKFSRIDLMKENLFLSILCEKLWNLQNHEGNRNNSSKFIQ